MNTHGGTVCAVPELELLESSRELAVPHEKNPNEHLAKLLYEADMKHARFAMEVNRVGTEQGKPTSYDESTVSHWLKGTMPRNEARAAIVEALSRRLFRPITHEEVGFPAPAGSPSSLGTLEGLIDLGRQDMDPSRRSVLGAV